jgi:hypothetical protein
VRYGGAVPTEEVQVVAQQLLEPAGAPWDDVAGGLSGAAPPMPRRLPVGRRGQLRALRQQLVWCDHTVRTAQRDLDRAMRDPDLEDDARWQAVRRLRTLAWKVCREVLPLVGRVPRALQAEPEYVECLRAVNALRRTTDAALAANAGHTATLLADR